MGEKYVEKIKIIFFFPKKFRNPTILFNDIYENIVKTCEKDDVYNKIRCNVIDNIDDCMYTNKKHNVLISNQIKKLNTPTKKINKKYYEDVNSLFFNNKNILEKSYKEQFENN